MKLTDAKVEIGFASILRFFLVIILLVFLFFVRDILVILFIAFLIASGFNPLVDKFSKKIPRILSVSVLYLTLVGLILLFAYVIKSTLTLDLSQFYSQIAEGKLNVDILGFQLNTRELFNQISSSFSNVEIGGFISGARKFLTGLTGTAVVFVFSFYMLLEKEGLREALSGFLPKRIYFQVLHLLQKIEEKVGGWLRGELILMIAIGILTYILLKALGMPYAGVLAIIAGITEIIPGVGPIFAGFLGTLVAVVVFPSTPIRWLFVAGGYTIIQQLENHILVPQVMKKAVGLSPIAILVSLLVGARLFGIVGALIAVPAAAALSVIISEWEESLNIARRG